MTACALPAAVFRLKVIDLCGEDDREKGKRKEIDCTDRRLANLGFVLGARIQAGSGPKQAQTRLPPQVCVPPRAGATLKTGFDEGKRPTVEAFMAERALRTGSSHAVDK